MTINSYNDIEQSGPQQEEWTQVRRKSCRNASGIKSQLKASPHQLANTVPRPNNNIPRLVLSDIRRDHDRIKTQWQDSTCQRQLKDLVVEAESAPSRPRVTQAVCLGIGSFDPEDGAWEVKRRAHIQLAAFLSIIANLRRQSEPSIRCFFQEPLFTSADKDFIRELGHEVVETPRGFDIVDQETLVFGVHLYRDIYNQAISKSVPAVFIGTGLDVWERYHGSDNLNWVRMKELDRQCDRVRFPEDEGFTTFSSTSIHWRKSGET